MTSTDTTTQAPVDQKPTDQKPVDQKPVDDKPVDQKPTDQKPVDDSLIGDKVADDKKPEPVAYTDFKLPDGFELDPKGLDEAKTLFNELGLNQEGAQKLVDLYAANMAGLQKQYDAGNEKLWADTRAQWTKAVEDDPEIGGAKLPETRASISKLFDKFGTPGLRDALKLTGGDNNPEIIKSFAKMAKALTEGKLLQGAPATGAGKKSIAERMYPTGPSQNIQGRPPVTTETT